MQHPELEILLEIQDLQTLRREVASPQYAAACVAVDPAEFAAHLEARVTEREQRLSPRTRARYERLVRRHERLVAPVLNGVCSACCVQVARVRGHTPAADLATCESCGRFLEY
jgi:predicted  nucleic acid-binding Zn-ribbon protein